MAEALRKDDRRRTRAAQDNAAAVARWQEQVRAAQLSGAVPPEPPTPIVVPGDSYVFHAERTRLHEAERALLAERADEYEAALAAREGELLAEVRELTGRLDVIAGEIAELTASAQTLRSASGSPTPVYGDSLTAAGLMEIVQRGARPLSYYPRVGAYVDARASAL